MESGETQTAVDITIREATPADMDWLIRQLTLFSAFNATIYPMLGDEEHARAGLLGMMQQHFLRIAERFGERLGLIAGYVMNHPFNPHIRVLCEAFWWVDPMHRNTRAGAMLLDEYVAWGKANCDWVQFMLQSNSPVSDKPLLKRGFRLHEKSYLLEVE